MSNKQLWQTCLSKTASASEALDLYKEAFGSPLEVFSTVGPGAYLGTKSGRDVGGEIAHEIAPKGHKTKSKDRARSVAMPLSAVAAIGGGLLTPGKDKVKKALLHHTNLKLKDIDNIMKYGYPTLAGLGTGTAAGATTGVAVGGYHKLKGHREAKKKQKKMEKKAFFGAPKPNPQQQMQQQIMNNLIDSYNKETDFLNRQENIDLINQHAAEYGSKKFNKTMKDMSDDEFAEATDYARYQVLPGMYKLASIMKEAATKKKKKKEERKDKSMLMRGLGAAAGTGMAMGSAPIASAMANPYHNVYHGTTLGSGDLIFNNELEDGFRGLATRFAGQADRINSEMLANTAIRSLYDLEIPLTQEQEINIRQGALDKMKKMRNSDGGKKFDSVKAVMDSAKEQLGTFLDKKDTDKVLSGIKDNVVESGKRIYTSTGANTVSDWASTQTEGDMLAKKVMNPFFQAKMQAGSMANILTGGIFPETRQLIGNVKFNRAANKLKTNTTREGTGKLLALLNSGKDATQEQLKEFNLSAKDFSNLKDRAKSGKLGVSIGTRLPVGESAMLNDFPGLNLIMAANPGVKHTAAELLPNMDPSRDLSVAKDIPIDHFRSIDLVDNETGKPLKRLMLDNPKMPKVTAKGMLKGLAKASPYAGLTLLGADLAQANIRGEDTFLSKGIRKATGLEKKAKIFSGSTRRGLQEAYEMAKGIAPALGVGLAVGAGADHIVGKGMDKLRESDAYKQNVENMTAQNTMFGMAADEARRNAEIGARQIAGMPLVLAGTAGLGFLPKKNRAALGAIKDVITKKKLPSQLVEHGEGLLSIPATSYGGLLSASIGQGLSSQLAEGAELGQASPLLAPFEGTAVEDKIRETPALGVLPAAGALAAIPIAGAYGLRKYYGGNLAQWSKNISNVKKDIVSDLRKGDKAFISQMADVDKRKLLEQIASEGYSNADYDNLVRRVMDEGAGAADLAGDMDSAKGRGILRELERPRLFSYGDNSKTIDAVKKMIEEGRPSSEIQAFIDAGGAD